MTNVEAYVAKQSFLSKANYKFWRMVIAGSLSLYTRLNIEGRENLPKSGAFVVAPVHRSYVDTPFVSFISRRRMRFMAKDSLWKNRLSGWLISSVGGFPVTRGTTDLEALRRCFELLGAGEPLVMFPEGERKSGPVVQPLFEGAAYVAARANVPIIPIGIGGSERVMPRGAKFLYPHKVQMIIGQPIQPIVSDNGRATRTEVRRLTAQLHEELQKLFDAAQARVGLK